MFTIAAFEFRTRLRLLSSWIYFLIFFALSFLWIAAAGGLWKEASVSFGSGKVFVNSPYANAQTVAFLGMFGLTVMAAIMGRAVQQDFEHRTQSFFFTAPITKTAYLCGRFLGALCVCMVIFSSIGLGSFLATYLPGMDALRLGPNRLLGYLLPYLFILLPNAILVGSIFFNLAAMTRKMLPVYIGSVLFLIGWLLGSQLLRDMDNKTIAALADPFGTRAMAILTEYWPISERNTRLLPFSGVLLYNRLLWLAVAALLDGVCFWRFSFARLAQERVSGKSSKSRPADAEKVAGSSGPAPSASPPQLLAATVDLSRPYCLLPGLTFLYFRETVKNVYFGVLVLAGVLFMIFSSTTLGALFGTNTWPVTFQMLGLLSGTFSLFMLIIIAFYGGELCFRERDFRFDTIVDATPVPTWVPFLSKLLALMLVPVVLQAVLLLCGVGIQLSKGYTHFEIGLYLRDLFGIRLLDYWLLCALAITVHSVINQKYVGHFVMTLYYILLTFSSQLGLEHNLYKFGAYPEAIYSDMNGFGHFLFRARVFQAYWTTAAVFLLGLGYLFWTRGTVSGFRERLAVARDRLSTPLLLVCGMALAAFLGLGGYIFYNTNVANPYLTTYDKQLRQADYEKKYKSLAALPQPKVTAVELEVELYPKEQGARMRGSYELLNKSGAPVDMLILSFAEDPLLHIEKLDIGVPSQLIEDDTRLGVRRYKLAPPLALGEKTTLRFDLAYRTSGFMNEGSNTAVVYNGTFMNGRAMLPSIGYLERVELERDQDRRKLGLAPKERMLDRDDSTGWKWNDLAGDSDFIRFESHVSTEGDQIAIAPGYLQKEWLEGGRHHYIYKMDAPILNFFAFQSARYAVRRDVWHDEAGKRDVQLEVYYQPGHEWNIDSMLASSKAALAYCSSHFGAFQYRQLRIIEFPRYETFAQSFPNTIPYSEGIGFIARVRADDPKDIDYPYYITAHEAAHQWWGHQVVGANVQGATAIVETLAQYSALMVMKHRYGEGKMRKFLAYELDRYLRDRAFEQKKEMPLARVENQGYIHYRKGSLVMYALQDYIGEDKVNQALKSFRDANAFSGPPYPNTTQLLRAIREVTPPGMQYIIDDMFENIVLYDNRAVSARGKKLPDGRYEVTIKVQAKKLRADSLGKEEPAVLADLIDIGVLDEQGEPLALSRQKITQEDGTYTIVVDKRPAKAGIDPLTKLIDRTPRDNVVPVEFD